MVLFIEELLKNKSLTMVKGVENIYVSKKTKMDLDKIYNKYAKEILARKGYPLRAVYKARILYEFSASIIKNISSIADVGGCYGYCLSQFQKLCTQRKQTKIVSTVYEMGKKYLETGPKIFPDINFIHSDKMGDKKYDLILLCDVLEHVIDYEDFLNKVGKISKKYILIWSPLELTFLRKILIRSRLFPKIEYGERHPDKHVNFWNAKETINIISNYFNILKIGYETQKNMTEKDGKEALTPRTPVFKRMFFLLMKYFPDYFYINSIGGHIIILCEVKNNHG